MPATIPTREPWYEKPFAVGDTPQWTISLPDYLPADGWTLKYAFSKTGKTIQVAGSDNGDGTHLMSINATTSAEFTAGFWSWQAFVVKGDERHTVRPSTPAGYGSLKIQASLWDALTGFDGRSDARKNLETVEQAIATKLAGGDISSYSISTGGGGSRSLARYAYEDLIKLRSELEFKVAQEEETERKSLGLGHGGRILSRMKRPS